jgi:hypothetical protein
LFVTFPASHLAPPLSKPSILGGRLAERPTGHTMSLQSRLSIEYIRLGGVVRVQQSPSTTHQSNLGLSEGLLVASKALRTWNGPVNLGRGDLGDPIRWRGVHRARIIED